MVQQRPPRKAPSIYERFIPIVLGVLVFLVILLGLVALAVLFGLWPA